MLNVTEKRYGSTIKSTMHVLRFRNDVDNSIGRISRTDALSTNCTTTELANATETYMCRGVMELVWRSIGCYLQKVYVTYAVRLRKPRTVVYQLTTVIRQIGCEASFVGTAIRHWGGSRMMLRCYR